MYLKDPERRRERENKVLFIEFIILLLINLNILLIYLNGFMDGFHKRCN